mgnify:CR=1 FL=1
MSEARVFLVLLVLVGVLLVCNFVGCSRPATLDKGQALTLPQYPIPSHQGLTGDQIAMGNGFELWIGKAKDEFVKLAKPPYRCLVIIATNEELCWWYWELTELLIFTYSDGIATDWTFTSSVGKNTFARETWQKQVGMERISPNPSQKTSTDLMKVLAVHFETQMGQTKDQCIQSKGPPDKCAGLATGGEICEWQIAHNSGNSARAFHIYFTFDQNGIAQAWRWRISFAQMSSDEISR